MHFHYVLWCHKWTQWRNKGCACALNYCGWISLAKLQCNLTVIAVIIKHIMSIVVSCMSSYSGAYKWAKKRNKPTTTTTTTKNSMVCWWTVKWTTCLEQPWGVYSSEDNYLFSSTAIIPLHYEWTIIIYVLLIEIDSRHHFKCHATQQEYILVLHSIIWSHYVSLYCLLWCHEFTHWQNTIPLYKCTLVPHWHNAAKPNSTRLQLSFLPCVQITFSKRMPLHFPIRIFVMQLHSFATYILVW